MATNNKIKNKKYNKDKLTHKRRQLIKSIAGCGGCSECRGAWEELHKINVILGIPSKLPNFSYLDKKNK